MRKTILLLSFTISIHAIVFGQLARIPVQLVDNSLVFIKIKVNNSDSLKFYFDTGAATTLIDERAASKIGLLPNYEQQVQGAGGNKTYKMALNQCIRIQDSIVIDSTHIVIDDLSRLKATLGQNFDGIIGYSVLKKYITKVDFDKHIIELYTFGTKVDNRAFSELGFSFKNGIPIPQFPITIELKNGTTYTDTVFFDSGAALSLLVNTPFKLRNRVTQQVGRTIETQTNNLSSASVQQEALIASLQIGKFKFGEHVIGLASDTVGVSSFDGYLGILGNKIIHRFNFIADYSTQKLYFQPNLYFQTAFEFPVSGMKLKVQDEKVMVASIVTTCDAYRLGIRENDTILSVNGIKSMDLSCYREILKKDDTNVSIKYRTLEGVAKRIKFKLRRLL
jgi:predicted aspartyl protease